ncbi:hypothetical protein EBQ74_07850, partial [bacterium]|nr:hypothetical protein [bacterium]
VSVFLSPFGLPANQEKRFSLRLASIALAIDALEISDCRLGDFGKITHLKKIATVTAKKPK